MLLDTVFLYDRHDSLIFLIGVMNLVLHVLFLQFRNIYWVLLSVRRYVRLHFLLLIYRYRIYAGDDDNADRGQTTKDGAPYYASSTKKSIYARDDA